MLRVIFAILAVLTAAELAWGDEPQGPLHHPPFQEAWVIFDSDCTDIYSLDGAGNPPPGGADSGSNGLDSTGSWNTLPDAYNLQANLGAPPQVSGAQDGLCDDAPWTIEGNLTIGADQDLHIGPIVLPAQGVAFMFDWTAIVLDYTWTFELPVPYDTATQWDWWGIYDQTNLTSRWYTVGPQLNSTSQQLASDESGIPAHGPMYLGLFLDNAGTWTVDAALIPYDTTQFGKDR